MSQKKYTYILIATLVVPFLLSIFIVLWNKTVLKAEVKENLKSVSYEKLSKLNLTFDQLSNLEWENDHEFEFNGMMYDLVKFEKGSHSVVFWCYVDSEETKLNQKLAELIGASYSKIPVKNQKEQLKQFLKDLYFNCYSSPAIHCLAIKEAKTYADKKIVNVLIELNSPPPEQS